MSAYTNEIQKKSATMPRHIMRGHTGWVRGTVHPPGGRRIITCSSDGSLRLWDLESGAQIGDDWRDEGDDGDDGDQVFAIALSPVGDVVASGSYDGTVRLWDIETGKVITKWKGHTKRVRSVCWSSDGEQVVSGYHHGAVTVWDVKTGKSVLGPFETGHEHVLAVICSPDTTKIATGGFNEHAIKIWDTKTGELLSTIKHDSHVSSLAWTSNGKKLISGSQNGLIRIFHTTTWQQIAILEGHQDVVLAISSCSNDRLLASASWDTTARLWNLETNLPVGSPLQHQEFVECVAFSADGKLLVTGSADHDAYLWDIYAILNDASLQDLLSSPNKVTAVKSSFDRGATRRATQFKGARRLPPGFFDDAREGANSSTTRGTHPHSSVRRRRVPSSGSHPRIIFGRFSSLFSRSQLNAGEATKQSQHHRQTIFAPRGPHVVEVAAVRDKQALFVARRPERDSDKAQQQRTKSQGQAQASSSQSQPAATSTSTTSPPAVQSRPIPLLARFVLFVCCASPPHVDGH